MVIVNTLTAEIINPSRDFENCKLMLPVPLQLAIITVCNSGHRKGVLYTIRGFLKLYVYKPGLTIVWITDFNQSVKYLSQPLYLQGVFHILIKT